ncbi:surface-adhesin E family protein [Candidatus Nitrotoga sp. 1052]|uniref:surface-adhesin E family protein n=1 Tax=Candidatus Nitrotoga sp. 1052 TaxID=2886964 RepID=UPI001EF4B4E2|nr:surface-adhesin E family protein [Candidatus Nitrotoga sp. 1052]CAH1088924.1 hypothetical protein NTG1052_70059 [Candidatus Nitrotoga sp. 1052]
MSTRHIICLLISSTVAGSVASAENWVPIGKSAEGSVFIVNFQWVKPGATEQKIMTLINVPEIRTDPKSGVRYLSTVNFQIADCKGKRIADTLTLAYAEANMKSPPVGRVEFEPPSWAPATPGSVNRMIVDAVCRK